MQRIVRDLSCSYMSMHCRRDSRAPDRRAPRSSAGRRAPYDRVDFTAFAHLRTEKDCARVRSGRRSDTSSARDPDVDDKMDLVRHASETPIDYELLGKASSTWSPRTSRSFHLRYLDPMTSQWVTTWDSMQSDGSSRTGARAGPSRPRSRRAQGRRRQRGRRTATTSKIFLPIQQPLSFRDPAMCAPRTPIHADPRAAARARRKEARARRHAHHGARRHRHHGGDARRVPGRRRGGVRRGDGGAATSDPGRVLRPQRRLRSSASSSPPSQTMRQAITPLFHADEADAAAAARVGVSRIPILGAFNDTGGGQGLLLQPVRASTQVARPRTWGSRAGASRSSVVDEDAKINVNMGAANQIAHIRLAKAADERHGAHPVRPALRPQQDATGNYHDRPDRLPRPSSTGPIPTSSSSCDMTQGRPRRTMSRTPVYQLLQKPLPPQERAVRFARGAAHGARHLRRLLGHLRGPRSDGPPQAHHDRVGAGARST